jgi:hypothetical protein
VFSVRLRRRLRGISSPDACRPTAVRFITSHYAIGTGLKPLIPCDDPGGIVQTVFASRASLSPRACSHPGNAHAADHSDGFEETKKIKAASDHCNWQRSGGDRIRRAEPTWRHARAIDRGVRNVIQPRNVESPDRWRADVR